MTNPLAQDLGGVVLLPCPFCGGDPIMWAATDCKDGFVHGTTINCQSCGISINDEYQDAAIADWNTRTHSAEIAGALRDAERWRWLRENAQDIDAPGLEVAGLQFLVGGRQQLDTAIDSAMQQGGGGGEAAA
jgi:Lar family restriction alleviation protein